MAAIREELILADRFSATFNRFLNLMRQSSGAGTAAAASQRQFETASGKTGDTLVRMAGAALEAASAMGGVSEETSRLAGACTQASAAQDKLNRSLNDGHDAASGLEKKLLSLAKMYIGLRTAQAFVNMADTFTQTTARLERMNDGMQTTAELQSMIYQAAQRSRGAYQEMADMVGKLGTMAGEAFNSNTELVAFAEQINKQFALAGTSGQGMQAAMLQLTQAMSSGTLRGEELNSILEQAPTIAKTIADYLGVTTGKMREMASEGEITAQVVKNAMFWAADETNAAFEKIPLTFGQAWTMAGNAAVRALEPAMQRLTDLLNSDLGQKAVNALISGFQLLGSVATGVIDLLAAGAQWVADNWDFVEAVLVGLGVAALTVGAQMAASAATSAIAWAAANWPLLLIVGSIALIIYMARQMGATWEDIAGVVGGAFGLMYAFAMNWFIVPIQNGIANLANLLGNFAKDPLTATKIFFLDMVTSALGYISMLAHGMEDLINRIPGFSVNLTSGIDSLYNSVRGAAQQAKDSMGWTEYIKPWEYKDYSGTMAQWSQAGAGMGRALDNFNANDVLNGFSSANTDFSAMLDASGIPGSLDAIQGDTAAIKRSVALSEEDMKLLVDMAERQYVNNINLTAQTPVITINGQNTGDTAQDLQWLENALQRILVEQAASHTDLSYQ